MISAIMISWSTFDPRVTFIAFKTIASKDTVSPNSGKTLEELEDLARQARHAFLPRDLTCINLAQKASTNGDSK